MNEFKPKFVLAAIAVLSLAFFRLIPHYPNFTPMATIALMGGAFIANRKLSIIIPFIALAITDLLTIQVINFGWTTPSEYFTSFSALGVYASFLVMIMLGWNVRNNINLKSITTAAVLSSIAFFVISNFGVFMGGTLPKTWAGLVLTYEIAIPFFAPTLAGSLLYTYLFFGIIFLVCSKWPELRTSKVIVRK